MSMQQLLRGQQNRLVTWIFDKWTLSYGAPFLVIPTRLPEVGEKYGLCSRESERRDIRSELCGSAHQLSSFDETLDIFYI